MSHILQAIASELIKELKPYTPKGVAVTRQLTHSIHISHFPHYPAKIRILVQPDKITVYHNFTIPDDWPYRTGRTCCVEHQFYYEDPLMVERIGKLVSSMTLNPSRRTSKWGRRRMPSPGDRERYRRLLVDRLAVRGVKLRPDSSFNQIRNVLSERFGTSNPRHLLKS